jgi:predicted metalloendopeptidase
LAKVDTVIVSQPKYMVALETMLKENSWPVESVHALEFIEQSIKPIVYDIENANFEFYGKP